MTSTLALPFELPTQEQVSAFLSPALLGQMELADFYQLISTTSIEYALSSSSLNALFHFLAPNQRAIAHSSNSSNSSSNGHDDSDSHSHSAAAAAAAAAAGEDEEEEEDEVSSVINAAPKHLSLASVRPIVFLLYLGMKCGEEECVPGDAAAAVDSDVFFSPALGCAACYLSLVSLPGMSSQLSPLLLRMALNCIKQWSLLNNAHHSAYSGKSNSTSGALSSSFNGTSSASVEEKGENDEMVDATSAAAAAAAAAAGSSSATGQEDDDPFAGEEEDDATRIAFRQWVKGQQAGTWTTRAVLGVQILLSVMSLRAYPESVRHCVTVLTLTACQALRLFPNAAEAAKAAAQSRMQEDSDDDEDDEDADEYAQVGSEDSIMSSVTSIAASAWKALEKLATPLHGNIERSVGVIFKALLPRVAMSKVVGHPSSEDIKVRTKCLKFAVSLAKSLGQPTYSSVLALLQHLTVRAASEKSDSRRYCTKAVALLASAAPSTVTKFTSFIAKLAKNVKPALRLVSVEMAVALIGCPGIFEEASKAAVQSAEAKGDEMESAQEDNALTASQAMMPPPAPRLTVNVTSTPSSTSSASSNASSFASGAADPMLDEQLMSSTNGFSLARRLIRLLLERVSDKSAAVRARALTQLAVAISAAAQDPRLNSQFSVLLGGGSSGNGASPFASPMSAGLIGSPGRSIRAPGLNKVMATLRLRAADSKVNVRKAALQVIVAILTAVCTGPSATKISTSDLQALYDGAMDTSPMVRKQAALGLTSLLQALPDDSIVQRVWMGAVLPLVLDREPAVQAKSYMLVYDIFLAPMQEALESKDENANCWKMIDLASEDMCRYMCIAVSQLHAQGKLAGLAQALKHSVAQTEQKGAWMVATEILRHDATCMHAEGIFQAFNAAVQSDELTQPCPAADHFKRVLSAFSCICTQLPFSELMSSAAVLFEKMCSTSPVLMSAEILKACMSTMCAIDGAMRLAQPAAREAGDPNAQADLPAWAEMLLTGCQNILHAYVLGGVTVEMDALIHALFTAGEVCLQTGETPSRELVILIKSLAAIDKQLVRNAPQQESGMETIDLPDSLCAHAFMTLGKMCLRDQHLAKDTVLLFVRCLQDANMHPSIRNNCLVILCDLCRTFTAVVDPYISSMTGCLAPKMAGAGGNSVLRRHTLLVLSQLLQEDYLKWKGSFFFRFLSCVADPDSSVSTVAGQLLTDLLTHKGAMGLCRQNFAEVIFFLNGCQAHPIFNHFGDEDQGNRAFSLVGKPRARMAVYRFLLDLMSDEDKFVTVATLCQKVIGAGAVEGRIPVDASTQDTLQDILVILASKQIKLSSAKGSLEEKQLQSAREAHLAAARDKILSKLAKKATVESIVPILLAFKRQLERRQSPLLRYLMMYLQELVKDYKKELEDVLAADRQLAAELAFDLQQWKQRQAEGRNQKEYQRLSMTPQGASNNLLNRRLSMASPMSVRSRKGGSPASAAAAAMAAAASPSFGTPRLRTRPSSTQSAGANMDDEIQANSNRLVFQSERKQPRAFTFLSPRARPAVPIFSEEGPFDGSGAASMEQEGEAGSSSGQQLTPAPRNASKGNGRAPLSARSGLHTPRSWNIVVPPTPVDDKESSMEAGDEAGEPKFATPRSQLFAPKEQDTAGENPGAVNMSDEEAQAEPTEEASPVAAAAPSPRVRRSRRVRTRAMR